MAERVIARLAIGGAEFLTAEYIVNKAISILWDSRI